MPFYTCRIRFLSRVLFILLCILGTQSVVLWFGLFFGTYAVRLYVLFIMITTVIIIIPILRSTPVIVSVVLICIFLPSVFLMVLSIVLRVETISSLHMPFNTNSFVYFLNVFKPVLEFFIQNCVWIQAIQL